MIKNLMRKRDAVLKCMLSVVWHHIYLENLIQIYPFAHSRICLYQHQPVCIVFDGFSSQISKPSMHPIQLVKPALLLAENSVDIT